MRHGLDRGILWLSLFWYYCSQKFFRLYYKILKTDKIIGLIRLSISVFICASLFYDILAVNPLCLYCMVAALFGKTIKTRRSVFVAVFIHQLFGYKGRRDEDAILSWTHWMHSVQYETICRPICVQIMGYPRRTCYRVYYMRHYTGERITHYVCPFMPSWVTGCVHSPQTLTKWSERSARVLFGSKQSWSNHDLRP